jgi:hypothetical protein
MSDFFDSMNRRIVTVFFSPWGTPVFAVVMALALFTFGLDPGGWTFWLIFTAAVGPFLLWDVACWILYAARGQSYREVQREVRRKTLAQMTRRRVEGRVQ